MNKSYFKRISVLFLVIITLYTSATAAGCHSKNPPDAYTTLSYSTNTILYAEPGHQHGSTAAMRTDMETTAVNATVYAFEPTIPKEERANCIRDTEALLKALNFTQHLYIYVYESSTLSAPYVAEQSLFTHTQSYRSTEYVASLLLAACGAYCNYGVAYGYASYLCEKLYGIPTDASALAFPTDFPYYDLNYLCFHPDFISEADLLTVKSIANDFVFGYITQHGEENLRKLLIQSGREEDHGEAIAALSAYYQANDVEADLSDILYGPGGKGCQYIARCPYATFCIKNRWRDRLTLFYPDAYDGFLNRDYSRTNEFFSVQSRQMKQYQDLFGLDDYRNDLIIVFSHREVNASYYLSEHHYIEIVNITSLMHEYIHSLTISHLIDAADINHQWMSEGLARCYDSLYSEYGNRMLYKDYTGSAALQPYIESLGRPLELPGDVAGMLDYAACVNGKTLQKDPYTSGASFIRYLILTFGEEETLHYLLESHDFATLTDASFTDTVADWRAYLQEHYGQYCK